MSDSRDEKLEKAAGWLREADGLLITAGAGMGVDSGLPDFHGRMAFGAPIPRFDTAASHSKTWQTLQGLPSTRSMHGASTDTA